MEDFDPDLDFDTKPAAAAVLDIDPAKYQHYIDLRRTHQHLPMATTAGIIGAVAAALAWLGVTAFTGLPAGWMGIAVGFVVGSMVRMLGQGIDRVFGLTAMLLSVAGTAVGMLLAGCWLVALKTEDAAFADLVYALTPGLIQQIYKVMLTTPNLVCGGIGIVLAYWVAIRRMRRDELEMCAVDPAPKGDDERSWAA